MTRPPPHLRLPGALLIVFTVALPLTAAQGAVPGPAGAAAILPDALHLAPGDARAYRVHSSGHTDVDFGVLAVSLSGGLGTVASDATGPTGRTRSSYDIAATLHWRVVARDASGFTLAAQLLDVDARFDDQPDARSDLLEAPFIVRLTPAGAVRAFAFPKRYPEALARTLRALVAPLAVALPSDATSAWASPDQSADGLFEARYGVTGIDADTATLQRIKSPLTMPYSGQIHRGRATAAITVARDTGALEALEVNEDMVTEDGGAFLGRHVGRLTAARVADAPPSALPATLAEAEATLTDDAFARARFYDVDPHVVPRVDGQTVPAILETFAAAVAKNHAEGHLLLQTYLRRYPASAGAIAQALDARPTASDDPVVVVGFAAIAAAGHREAQEALVVALTSPDSSARARERALISMMDLAMPEHVVLEAVWETRERFAAAGPGAALSLSIATNVYGALGDAHKGNPDVTAEVLATLADELASATDRFARVVALDGLTNIGDFALVGPLVEPHFGASDPAVRVAAFVTFRRMPTEAAFARFATHFAREADPAVRREAALVARDMPATEARNAWAQAVAREVSDPAVLIPVVGILGDALSAHPDNEAALRALLDTHRDRQVRREVYAFVSPVAVGGAK